MKRVKNSARPIAKAGKQSTQDLQKDDRRICMVTKDNTIVRFGCEWYGEKLVSQANLRQRHDTRHSECSTSRNTAGKVAPQAVRRPHWLLSPTLQCMLCQSPTASSDTSFIDLHSNYLLLHMGLVA